MSTISTAPRRTEPGVRGIPPGFAAVLGVLAVGAAVGVGQLVAALVSPASSPVLAVGNAVINYSPEPLTEFAKTHFGTNDKPILLSGMAVVITAVAAAGGLASRRFPRPGVVTVVVLGLAGLLAVVAATVFSPLDVIAPLVSLGVGLVVFRRLHGLTLRVYQPPPEAGGPVTEPSEGAGESSGGVGRMSRRNVLFGSSAALGVVSLGSGIGGLLLADSGSSSRNAVTAALAKATLTERAPAIPVGASFAGSGTPTFITANPDFYRIDVALRIPSQTASDWRLRIHGLVERETTLTFADLMRRPLVERTITMTCVSNPVGGNLISTANFIGVELRPILLEAGIHPGAQQLFTTSIDGWNTSTPTDVVLEPDRGALLAIGMNGEALPPEHGFPVRMIVPGLYGYVSGTKWLSDMEVTTFSARRGYWYQRGWSEQAPIKTESRIDRPRAGSSVPAGTFTCAGIAWSQPTGIEAVEVRVDGGPWQTAQLSTEVNGRTWRMWRTDVDLAPGHHTVQTRATNHDGAVQTDTIADPIPNGASGWPATTFTVV
ncbi:MAG: oxidoreductase molybdopterin binding protein [Pseudonocardia sp.]|nr:oxidoreductase molybdopterin binding protein [Pseudonocardia sp.]